MGRNGEGESEARTSSSSNAINSHSNTNTNNTILRTRPDPFLIVCRGFSVITALTAILCIAVNVLSAIRSFKDGSDVLSLSLSLSHSLLYVRDFYFLFFEFVDIRWNISVLCGSHCLLCGSCWDRMEIRYEVLEGHSFFTFVFQFSISILYV